MHQIRFRLGLHPDPTGGAYSTPPEPLAGLREPTSKGRERMGTEENGEGEGKRMGMEEKDGGKDLLLREGRERRGGKRR